MRKYIFALLPAAMIAATAIGAPISQTQALKKATQFLNERGRTTADLKLVQSERQPVGARTGSTKEASYYVFNQGTDKGFVIISGDDKACDVLGYADRGHFDIANIPENMQALLDCYTEEIAMARANDAMGTAAQAAKSPATAANEAWQVIAPMLTTSWNQSEPFNLECFTPGGSQAVTGCVATAFAQVMYYHKWPRKSRLRQL